ncbi:ABC transporter substrate-binding protein [Paenibacillus thalictri]|uniref:Extracellular solute-binding protein n=1 Tax=Paenibacillus thalictri TaxID=2527873 RepID=A0A4Q9DML8_9BACL|nr:extracellular solute-binding protein [Paenibacillus thalictri]TBL73970.1 extracellular solute-binding protein [Paenibacillus thalictri]
MRQMKKGSLVATSLLLSSSLLFAACSEKPAENAAAPSPAPAKSGEAAKPATPAGIDMKTVKANIRWVYPGTSESEKEFAEGFKQKMKEKYPNIDIEIMYMSWADMEKKVAVMVNSGDAPDIMALQDVSNWAKMDALEDLAPYLDRKESSLHKDTFNEATLKYATIDNKVYALPAASNAFSLIVNEKMLGDVGMKLEDLKTWDDVEKAAKLMTKDGKYGFGYPLGAARFAFRVPFTMGYSNDLVISDTSDASKQKYIELLNHLKNLEPYNPKAHVTWGYPEMHRAFANGEVGMIASGTFYSSNVYSINPDIIGVSRNIAYPKGPSGSKAKAPVSSSGYGLLKGSKNKEVAWKLLEEMYTPEQNSITAAIVNVTAVKTTSADEVMKKAEKIYPKAIEGHKRILADMTKMLNDNSVEMDKILGQPEMEPIVQDNIMKMLTNKSTPEEAYKNIKTEIDKIKAQYK